MHVTCCARGHHEKSIKILHCSFSVSEFPGQISRKTVDSIYPIDSFKDEGFSRETSAKHVTLSYRDMSTQKAARQ